MNKKINALLYRLDTSSWAKHSGFFLSRPRGVILEATNRCNVTCDFCQRSDYKEHKPNLRFGEMSIATLRAALEPIKDTITFVGLNGYGEPLSHSDFPSLVREAHRIAPAAELSFHTNGIRLDAEKLMPVFVDNNVASISISLDSVDANSYKRLHRNRDHFNRIVTNIAACSALVREWGAGPRFSITYTIVPGNEESLPDFVRLAARLGVPTAGPVHIANKLWVKDKYTVPAGFEEKVLSILDEAKEEARRLGIKFHPPKNRSMPGSMGTSPIKGYTCAWPIGLSPLIDWQGNVMICCWLPSPEQGILGNIHEMPFDRIWNGRPFRTLRRGLAKGRLPSGCNDCRLLGMSSGDVPEDDGLILLRKNQTKLTLA